MISMLERWYSLDECANKKLVVKKLKDLESQGKIEYTIEKSTDIFEIEDLDLEDSDIDELIDLFEKNDVFPYLDKNDDEDDYGYYGDDEEEDY
jgi:hypothetical protein